MKERRASQKLSSKSIMDPNQNVKCKIVVVGDSQCGKTALLHVFAKDCFPEVSVTRASLRGAAGGVLGLEDSVVSPASLIFLLESLSGAQPVSTATLLGSECPASIRAGTRQHPWALGPRNLLVSVWEAGWEEAACLLCAGSVPLLVVAF